ncbi:Di-and tricarboxylate transporter [Prosthecobacter debontii]|uniref:Di-and tricarboxylate transporter n=1 Tax=Prosthecobacter debontii TaxID=48467 RepID=A0A1T4X937_9BACT|nr:SLC13 family permease [Prosthecobacter debontii]SKA85595.1 Di-and tricarboxylate transporter [Prosthecobacter debontii]
MEFDLIVTLVTLVGAVVLFATEKLPVDIVALLVTGVLLGCQVVTVEEGIAGFSNPAVITVACMFILSAALEKTGALSSIGRLLARGGGGTGMLCFLVMLCVAPVSAFVNNTAAVAVFLPLIFAAAAARKVPASRVLIPLSFAAQFGGVCTLIGTSTNLLVNSIALEANTGGFSMFEFAPLGLILTVAGMAFLLGLGHWLLPHRRSAQLTDTYQLGEYVTELRVMEDSPLIGQSIGATPLSREYDVSVLEIRRGKQILLATVSQIIMTNDLLLVRGQAAKLMAAKSALRIEIEPEFKLKDEALRTTDLQLCEAIVPAASSYAGRTLEELRLGRRTGVIALAVQRTGQVVREKLGTLRLRFGDALLLLGDREGIDRLRSEEGLLILNELESSSLHRHKAPFAFFVMAMVVALAALEVLPILVCALLGVLALLIFRNLRPDQAYAAVDWRVLVMLAGILPLGVAMQKTGAAQAVADFALNFAGKDSPTSMLAALYLVTAILTECMSNNGAAVLMAPIAITTAHSMGMDPKPFLVAVTVAASTSFATPIGYQTNTMVYNAGGYRFSDFLKVGIPLNLLFWGIAVFFIPKFWSFYPG